MQQLSVQMQQLQRQFGHLCQEMLGLQSVMNQIASQLQSVEGGVPGIPSYRGTGGSPGLPSGLSPAHAQPSVQPPISPYGSASRESPYGARGSAGMRSTSQSVAGESGVPTYFATALPPSLQNNAPAASLIEPLGANTTWTSATAISSVGRQSEYSAYGRDFTSAQPWIKETP